MNNARARFFGIISNWMRILILGVLCIIMLLPISWIVSTSLRLPSDSFRMPPSFFPTSFRLDAYHAVFEKFPFMLFIGNSLYVAVMSVLLNIAVTTMAAYAFARIDFKGKSAVFLLILSGMMIPSFATMIPLYIVMSRIKLVGSLWALILPSMISPMSIFLVRQFMITIPKSYEEAARIDGAGRIRVCAQVIAPMSMPSIIMTMMLCFLGSWNNFMGPLIYLSDWNKMTLPIGLRLLVGSRGTGNVSEILAGSTISLIAPLLLYIIGQRQLIQGVALSGIKS